MQRLENMANWLEKWLKKYHIAGKTSTLKIKYSDFIQQTRSKTLLYFILDKGLILESVKEFLFQAFVIWKNNSGKFTIKYSGGVDDSALEPKKAKNYLEKAVDELLENKAVSNPNYSIFGLPHIFSLVYDKMR